MPQSALLAFLVLAGCAGPITNLPVYPGSPEIPCCGPDYYRHVQIQYLGAGGYLIRRGKDVLLTAPLFSNPSLLRVGFWYIKSQPGEIEKFLPPVQDAAAILVGHAHYDHLMDVPYIAHHRVPPTTYIYGSETMKNILSACPILEGRLVSLDAQAATFHKPGTWQYVAARHIRFMAIQSEHAPHFWGIEFFSGEVLTKQTTLPKRASGWKEGQTFTYLIDFLGPQETVIFRIYYQDAASTPPLGLPPVLAPQDQRRIDVAILCVPSFDQVQHYPEGILLYTQPRAVILGHWEDFFRPWTNDLQQLKVVPLTDPQLFIARMQKVLPSNTPWYLPRPGAWMPPFTLGQP